MAAGVAGVCLKPVMALASEHSIVKALPRAKPSEVGVDPKAVLAFIEAVNTTVGGLHSMMLLRHGKVAAEAWWKPFEAGTPHMLYSLSKSFTSTAVGLAVAEGKLSVEDKVVSFFPDKLPATVSENLAAMRVKDLLTMSTGHDKEPERGPTDWVRDFLAAPVEHKPGTHFLYNTSATHILAAIVTKVTGMRMLDYLKPRLFDPLGIEGMTWEQSPSGIDTGGFGLKVRTEDIAKFGQLYLQKGQWEGKQLIPAAWVEEATQKQVSNGDPSQENDWSQGYGYQFWRSQHGNYRGDGAFGQYCLVMPAHDAVLAITSGVSDMGAVLKAVWTHLLPGLKDGAPSAGEAELKKALGEQTVPGPVLGEKSSPNAARVSGKTWTIEENPDKVRSLKLTFRSNGGELETTSANGAQKIPFGYDRFVKGPDGTAARGLWTAPDRFTLKVYRLDSPHAAVETYLFNGNDLKVLDRTWSVAFGPRERPELNGKTLA
ncbi:class C beta-lactamase-related serine hydrolase [bacterium]|nr:MAG: class C beta-lactamase-related serine hydrolase [bacterium]